MYVNIFLWKKTVIDVDVLLLLADVSVVAQMEKKTRESWTSAPC